MCKTDIRAKTQFTRLFYVESVNNSIKQQQLINDLHLKRVHLILYFQKEKNENFSSNSS